MSLMLVAFFGTLLSAQVLTRNQVDARQIQSQKQTMNELKVKAKAQGLKAIPAEWIKEAKQANKDRLRETSNKRTATAKTGSANKTTVQKRLVERKLIQSQNDKLSLREQLKQITPPPGYKVGIREFNGKEYIQFFELPQQNGMQPIRAKN